MSNLKMESLGKEGLESLPIEVLSIILKYSVNLSNLEILSDIFEEHPKMKYLLSVFDKERYIPLKSSSLSNLSCMMDQFAYADPNMFSIQYCGFLHRFPHHDEFGRDLVRALRPYKSSLRYHSDIELVLSCTDKECTAIVCSHSLKLKLNNITNMRGPLRFS